MRLQFGLVILAGALGGSAPACVAKNLVRDGSFETPPTAPQSYNTYGQGSTFGAWTVVGASGNVATVASGYMGNGFTLKSKHGKAWLDLTGTSNTVTGVAQTVKTVAGTAYTLTFWVGNIYDPNGPFGTTSTVNVYEGTSLLISATNSKMGVNDLVWRKFSVDFTASGSTTALIFLNGDPSSDNNNGLDAISLTPAVETRRGPLTAGLSR